MAQNCSADRSTLTNWTRKEVFCGKRVTIHNYTGSVGTQATCAKTNTLSDGDNLIVIHSGIGTWTQPKLKPDHACAYKMGDVNKTSPSLARCKSECVNDTKCLSIEWYSVASLCSLSYSNAASIFANTVGPSCEYHEYDRPALSASSGTCECSNGAIYTVSGLFNVSSGDPCGGGLACDFGIAGQCNPQRNLSSSRRRVICGQEKTTAGSSDAVPNFSAPGHTEGTCTCIDGTTYTINGDDHGNCSVSCENGIIGDTCVLRDPVSLWPRKSVVCGPTLSHKDGPNHLVDRELARLVKVVAVEHELDLADEVHPTDHREAGQELERIHEVVLVRVEAAEDGLSCPRAPGTRTRRNRSASPR